CHGGAQHLVSHACERCEEGRGTLVLFFGRGLGRGRFHDPPQPQAGLVVHGVLSGGGLCLLCGAWWGGGAGSEDVASRSDFWTANSINHAPKPAHSTPHVMRPSLTREFSGKKTKMDGIRKKCSTPRGGSRKANTK